ncbi:putative deoxyribonuclease TATDN2, partial [Trichonephila clavata]
NKCPREIQKAVFRRQLIIGYSRQLPLVIHCREAHEDCIKIILETIPYDYTFHLHCFAENWYWADRWLKTFPNVYIGITNLVTFASRYELRDVAERIPLDRLLLETDAPYCIPKIIFIALLIIQCLTLFQNVFCALDIHILVWLCMLESRLLL